MAMFSDIKVYLEFEEIIKLVCENIDCRFNLANDANTPDRREAACNLKQITITNNGLCKNYEKFRSRK